MAGVDVDRAEARRRSSLGRDAVDLGVAYADLEEVDAGLIRYDCDDGGRRTRGGRETREEIATSGLATPHGQHERECQTLQARHGRKRVTVRKDCQSMAACALGLPQIRSDHQASAP